ncbi:MAG TPA: sulfotransferase [Burkholderiaceae bacterium]|nr:sulfotransferase [Burkholderiaceae bacterium]
MPPLLEAPIIIIGNGGSGSTLLDRVLNAHPEIEMQGEMKFLVADAWAAFQRGDANSTLRDLHRHFDADPNLEARIKSDPEQFRALLQRLEEDELRRKGRVLRQSISAWYRLDECERQFWGFKEITNYGLHDWACYDAVFPKASWVHIVRHPIEWLHSAARLSKRTLSGSFNRIMLKSWVATIKTSRQRAATGRYYEVRYEDLQANAAHALAPLLGGLGLAWHRECELPLYRQWGTAAQHQALRPRKIRKYVSSIVGLEQLMSDYGYSAGGGASEPDKRRFRQSCLERLPDGGWKIVGPVLRDSGNCWEVDLSEPAIADELAAIADDVGQWERSPLRVFECGKALGPAHELHFRIRREGGGRYSHWQNKLLFSSTDNSSPNDNGRVYSFDLRGRPE